MTIKKDYIYRIMEKPSSISDELIDEIIVVTATAPMFTAITLLDDTSWQASWELSVKNVHMHYTLVEIGHKEDYPEYFL